MNNLHKIAVAWATKFRILQKAIEKVDMIIDIIKTNLSFKAFQIENVFYNLFGMN